MKRFLQTILVAFVTVSFVSAQTKAVETFDYSAGAAGGLGSAGNGWGGAWTLGGTAVSDSIKIVAGSLEHTGLNTTGNKLEIRSLTTAGSEISRTLASTWADVAGEYWISFLFEVKNTPAINDSWQGFSLDNAGEQGYIGKLWGQDKIGINDPSPYLNVPSTFAYTSGVAWLVTRIKMSGGAGVDTAYMWINHDPSKTPSTQETGVVKADITLDNGFNTIRLHLGMASGIKVSFDEIRIGTSWIDVTSPKATAIFNKSRNKSFITVSNNRANNLVTFEYSLQSSQLVKLEIYSIEGKAISALINTKQSAGLQNVRWHTNNIQKGIYLYKLKIGGSIQTGKILLF